MANGADRSRDMKVNTARRNIQGMIAQGATDHEIATYIAFAQDQVPGLEPSQIFDPNHAKFVRDFMKIQEPLPQAETAAQAGANLATVAMTVAPIPGSRAAAAALRAPALGAGRVGPMLRETGRVAAGAGIGSAVGETFGPREPGEGMEGAIGRTALRTVEGAAFNTATRGLAEVFAFLRGAGPTLLQKKGQEFARKTTVEGRPLTARSEQFTERAAAGKMGRGIQRTVAGRLFAKQQGMKVASFLEQEVLRLSGRQQFVEPSNAVAQAAPLLARMRSPQAAKFAEGVGRNFENAGIWLDQFFSPANQQLVRFLSKANRAAFDEAKAAWFQKAIRESVDDSVPSATHLLFDGNRLRAWYEGNRKMIAEVMGKEQDAVIDGFTAYMKFASPTAKRAFQDTNSLANIVQTGAEAGLLAGVGGPLGQMGVGAVEAVSAGLSVLLSRPGNAVYRLFSEPLAPGFKAGLSRGARIGAQAGAFRAIQPTGESRGGDPRFPAKPPALPAR